MRNYHFRINCPRRKLRIIVLHPTECFISISILAKILFLCIEDEKKRLMTELYISIYKEFVST